MVLTRRPSLVVPAALLAVALLAGCAGTRRRPAAMACLLERADERALAGEGAGGK